MSLVTLARYRLLRPADNAADDSTVTAWLTEAELLVADAIGRASSTLAQVTVTERLKVTGFGRCWPSSGPVVSVSNPTAVTITSPWQLDHVTSSVAWDPVVDPDRGVYTQAGDPSQVLLAERVDTLGGAIVAPPAPALAIPVTYVGGWTSDTLPVSLAHEVVAVAFAIGHPAPKRWPSTAGSAGPKRASEANQSGPAAGIDALVPGISRRLRSWTVTR